MATEVTLPELGESVTEGTVTRWLKQVGDSVAMDEPLLEVSTDKVDTEIPSPAAGTLLEQKVSEDDTVEVGGLLAGIGDEGEGGGSSEESSDEKPAEEQTEEPAEEPAEEPKEESNDEEPADEAPAEAPEAKEEAPAPKAGTGAAGGAGTEVNPPEPGESVHEGTVTHWRPEEGRVGKERV